MFITFLALLLTSVSAKDYCKLCEDGSHTMCQYKEGPAKSCIDYKKISLAPGDKRYILDIHNDIRNHVASGQENRGALGNQPPAADMFVLEWDEELAQIAQRWVDQCVSINATEQHDKCKRTERFEVGQNIVTVITNDVELPELSLLILNWYKQITNVIPSDIDNFTGIWRGKQLIGHYTQLVWARTKFVGCAASAFKENFTDEKYNIRFICNYGPAGNIIGQSVYKRGTPCAMCPHRMCDSLRPNLCSGIDRNEEKPELFKKHREKTTTLSNFIDIDGESKDNISRIFNIGMLNMSEISKTASKTSSIDISTENFHFTTATSIDKTNFSNHSTIFDNKKNYTSTEQDGNFTTVGIVSSIKSLIHDFFNQSIIQEVEARKNFIEGNKSIIDLTKAECEKRVELENGMIIVPYCGDRKDWYHNKKHFNTFQRRINLVEVKDDDIILPGNRHFRRASGIWHNGHCRCFKSIRSHSSTINSSYFLLNLISLVYLLTIYY